MTNSSTQKIKGSLQ